TCACTVHVKVSGRRPTAVGRARLPAVGLERARGPDATAGRAEELVERVGLHLLVFAGALVDAAHALLGRGDRGRLRGGVPALGELARDALDEGARRLAVERGDEHGVRMLLLEDAALERREELGLVEDDDARQLVEAELGEDLLRRRDVLG